MQSCHNVTSVRLQYLKNFVAFIMLMGIAIEADLAVSLLLYICITTHTSTPSTI